MKPSHILAIGSLMMAAGIALVGVARALAAAELAGMVDMSRETVREAGRQAHGSAAAAAPRAGDA